MTGNRQRTAAPRGTLLGRTQQQREYKLAHHYLVLHPEEFTSARVSDSDFCAVPYLGELWDRAKSAAPGWTFVDLVKPLEWDTYKGEIDTLTSAEMFSARAQIGQLEAKVIETNAVRSAVIETRGAVQDVIEGKLERDQLMALFERVLQRLRSCGDDRWVSLRDAAHAVARDLLEAQSGKKPLVVEMPLPSLMAAVGGWRRGRVHMIQAITSGHKTTLARMAVEHVASVVGEPAVYISLEDTEQDLAARSIAERSRGKIEVRHLVSGDMPDREGKLQALIRVITEIDNTDPKMLIRHQSLTLSQVVSLLHEAASRGAVLAAIDFFQLIRPDSGGEADTDFWLVAASRLQSAAIQTGMALVLCVQPTQEATKRAMSQNHVLGLGDMRGGSAISQAAYGVLSLGFKLDNDGKRMRDRIYCFVQKWKSASPGQALRFYLDAAHDTIAEWNPPYSKSGD